MGKSEFSNIEKQIRDALEDAVDSLDFKQLNKTISSTISVAVDEVQKQFADSIRRERPWGHTAGKEPADGNSAAAAARWAGSASGSGTASASGAALGFGTASGSGAASASGAASGSGMVRGGSKTCAGPLDKLRINPPSRTESVLLTVFGSIGLGMSLVALIAILASNLFFITVPMIFWILIVLMLTGAGVSAILLARGNALHGRLKRLKLYLREVEDKTYCTIRGLVGRTGKPEKYVLKDLKRMMKAGILPHAHIDRDQTYLMLDDETWEQYLLSMESLKERTQKLPDNREAEEKDSLDQVTAEGREYLKKLRELNDVIPGEVISVKLRRLETVIEKIFYVLSRHPEQANDMERFMEYYLPTTIKLVSAYRDFDSIGISGDNISMVKTDVEETLDTINQAFEQLLDSLFQNEAFDISTDASVLQTMLRKDGYVSSDFDRRDET